MPVALASWTKVQWQAAPGPLTLRAMTKKLSEMTRADWLSRRWINVTPPGTAEMVFTDAGDFPEEQRSALLSILASGRDPSGPGREGLHQGPIGLPETDG